MFHGMLLLEIIDRGVNHMRMRHKPWANDFLAENADIAISDPAQYKGRWNTVFGNDNPIHIEVGTGKGQFISGMAKQNPDINYIGISGLSCLKASSSLPSKKLRTAGLTMSVC